MGKQQTETSLKAYKRGALRIAKQLGYSKKIEELIQEATTENEVTRAMMKGRDETDKWRR